MAVDWSSASFEANPAGVSSPSLGDDVIRELKVEIRSRVAKEHWFTVAGSGTYANHGYHMLGAARPYFQAANPTTLPDGTALGNDFRSLGRMLIKSNADNIISVYNGSTWIGINKEVTRASIQGVLAVASMCIPPICFTRTITIARVMARIGTRPTTNNVIINLKKRGPTSSTASIFNSSANRPVLSTGASGYSCLRTSLQMSATGISNLSPSSWLQLDIVQVGGTSVKGSDLSVVIEVGLK